IEPLRRPGATAVAGLCDAQPKPADVALARARVEVRVHEPEATGPRGVGREAGNEEARVRRHGRERYARRRAPGDAVRRGREHDVVAVAPGPEAPVPPSGR